MTHDATYVLSACTYKGRFGALLGIGILDPRGEVTYTPINSTLDHRVGTFEGRCCD